jgi:hypothetical protein
MPDNNRPRFTESSTEVWIVGLNKDKTRKTNGSYTSYQVYFELSEAPAAIWRDIFGREWNDVNTLHDAKVDGRFLVISCPLVEIASIHLPGLKKAVAASNSAYIQYVSEQLAEAEGLDASWIPQIEAQRAAEQERKNIDALADQLRFE